MERQRRAFSSAGGNAPHFGFPAEKPPKPVKSTAFFHCSRSDALINSIPPGSVAAGMIILPLPSLYQCLLGRLSVSVCPGRARRAKQPIRCCRPNDLRLPVEKSPFLLQAHCREPGERWLIRLQSLGRHQSKLRWRVDATGIDFRGRVAQIAHLAHACSPLQ